MTHAVWNRLQLFLTPIDARYEDIRKDNWYLTVWRDFSAGLIVAMMAIPMAMGFAIASGLQPEQGIVGGAVAGIVGALFGGSKYQVYGPTAAFIPIIAGTMAAFVPVYGFEQAHAIVVFSSIIAGGVLMCMGVAGLGRFASLVPHSIVVGFTIGIAVTIATSQIGEVFGIKAAAGKNFLEKVQRVWEHLGEWHGDALLLAGMTFLLTKYLLRISIYIPGPLIALAVGTLVPGVLRGDDVSLIKTKYGPIPTDFWVITPPALPDMSLPLLESVAYLAVAIVFVSGVESLLCSRMADRLADNRGTPFNPNKEFWGQGLVQVIVPLLNGFPHTGALARTATNIKLGAVTPLAGILKGVLKLSLAYYLARYLELVPTACIGGLLMWVAANMVKPAEVQQVLAHGRFHVVLMVYTAVMVTFTDFLTGVLTAMALYGVLYRFLERPAATGAQPEAAGPLAPAMIAAAARPPRPSAPNGRTNIHRYRHLMVGLSRTKTDIGLLRYAAMVARQGTATNIRFVHVLPTAPGHVPGHDQALAEIEALVHSHFTGVGDKVRASFDVLHGPLTDRLLAHAAEQEVDLIFLGHRRDHPRKWALARRMAMKAPCSVWLVPDGADATLNRILVPTDFSEPAADAMRVATSMARLCGHSQCLALHVYFNPARATYEDYEETLRGKERDAYQRFMAPIDCQGVKVTPGFEEEANAAHAINRVANAQGVDLIVMATRGRSRSAAILLGSTAEDAILETGVPLLLVKHSGARLNSSRCC